MKGLATTGFETPAGRATFSAARSSLAASFSLPSTAPTFSLGETFSLGGTFSLGEKLSKFAIGEAIAPGDPKISLGAQQVESGANLRLLYHSPRAKKSQSQEIFPRWNVRPRRETSWFEVEPKLRYY